MNATNPVFANAEGTVIDLLLNHPKHGVIPFSASPNDVEPLGKDLYSRALAGEFGALAPYAAPVIPQEVLDARINAVADAEIRRISLEALPDIIDWLARNATGADRAAMQTKLAAITAEKAKKK